MNLTCPVYRYWGLYCPGCGGTRALKALLQGEVLRSLWYHPFVFYAVCCIMGRIILKVSAVIFNKEIFKKENYDIVSLGIGMGIILLNCIIKNIFLLCFGIELI